MFKKRSVKPLSFLLFLLMFFAGKTKAQQKEQILHSLNELLINVVMEDLFTPPVASRIYVYPNIAFYECIRTEDPSLPSLTGKLNGLNTLPISFTKTDAFISASVAYTHVAQALVATEHKFENWRNVFIDSLRRVADESVLNQSLSYGKRLADSIISWLNKDNYLRSRGYQRFTATDSAGSWHPTPAEYLPAMEPHWNTLRPLTLNSASQFSPKEKLRYSEARNSVFFRDVMKIYEESKRIDTLKKAAALYWDDNPNISIVKGHLTYFVHKISPGGHWLKIAQQALQQKNVALAKSAQVYAFTSIAVFDAFISCWDEKYKTNLIRPVTVINRFIDENWSPYIQTPPFPEFTSGHSVVSNAASSVLTFLLGDNFEFTDNTEIPFGMTARTFTSFNAASYESSMSRVWGGIHYYETARISIQQGQAIGKYVIKKLLEYD